MTILLDSRTDHSTSVREDQGMSVGAGSSLGEKQRWDLAHLNALIRVAADTVDDLENVRMGNHSRGLHLTRTTPDKDGEQRGLGLPVDHPEVQLLQVMNKNITALEEGAVKHLQRLMQRHPLGPWAKQQKGVGDKQIARFLAAVGDPYIRPAIDYEDGTREPERVRTLPEFRSYCGYALSGEGVALARAKGQKLTWNPEARMRLWNVADSCLKGLRAPCVKDPVLKFAEHGPDCACFPYRLFYDDARKKYVTAVHERPCARCTPKGALPAPVGSPLSGAHKHSRGLRAISQRVLVGVWRESRRIHCGDSERNASIQGDES